MKTLPYCFFFPALLSLSAFAHAQSQIDMRALTQGFVQNAMQASAQAQKAELETVAAKCAKLNAAFSERFRKNNAEWEEQTVRAIRVMTAMNGFIGAKRPGDFGVENAAQVAAAMNDKSMPATLPTPDNKALLMTSAETRISQETQGLSGAELYVYCEKKLEKSAPPSSASGAASVWQGM